MNAKIPKGLNPNCKYIKRKSKGFRVLVQSEVLYDPDYEAGISRIQKRVEAKIKEKLCNRTYKNGGIISGLKNNFTKLLNLMN